jgi:predicted alpha/beta superfamily hydrolase
VSEPNYYGYLRVFYPLKQGHMVLRTEGDWEGDLEPVGVESLPGDCMRFDFLLEHDRPYLFCKPVILKDDGGLQWSVGPNKLVILTENPQNMYPHFFTGDRGRITEVLECPSAILGRNIRVRLHLPPGYDENYIKRYPVLYMHDGANLFFPAEAFLGNDWRMEEHLGRLDAMTLIDRMIVVGVYAEQRMEEYTKPGYETYGRAVVEELKPWLDEAFRTLPDPSRTVVLGSSLGGVVSFYLAWEYPHVFGNAACMSSTFGYKDDLLQRVRSEPSESRSKLKLYLDSGWPKDNYEVTLSMVNALVERGFQLGGDVLHLAFPLESHTEAAWAARVPIPLQLFSGRTRRAARRHAQPHPTSRHLASRVFSKKHLLE